MGAIANVIGNMARPLFLGLLLVIGLGFMTGDPHNGHSGAACRDWTTDPELNRTLCRYHPTRILNTPVTELVPWIVPDAKTDEAS
ncbi:hypothetical protein [Tropicimonas marinistellae]|uniref:hypothetical protein n=1 Tax=Tropicimonas marinistellae TaxID=1739787 RepID=UPI000829A541|nr:hypothetical protein [Tropicimonas marinistellae]